ncbi:MAG: hypothetical protein FK732_08955 [Asgard group archaeon]|nr:hypothetical protein [Asgard group archaeon]
MEVSVQFYYWHEVMGPLQIYSNGLLEISEEDLMMLFSTIEPYSCTPESSILGPKYYGGQIIMTYNRSVCDPDANDERLRIMGTDVWCLISCKEEFELVLLSIIEIVKIILDIEFDSVEEVHQLDAALCERATHAIRAAYSR